MHASAIILGKVVSVDVATLRSGAMGRVLVGLTEPYSSEMLALVETV